METKTINNKLKLFIEKNILSNAKEYKKTYLCLYENTLYIMLVNISKYVIVSTNDMIEFKSHFKKESSDKREVVGFFIYIGSFVVSTCSTMDYLDVTNGKLKRIEKYYENNNIVPHKEIKMRIFTKHPKTETFLGKIIKIITESGTTIVSDDKKNAELFLLVVDVGISDKNKTIVIHTTKKIAKVYEKIIQAGGVIVKHNNKNIIKIIGTIGTIIIEHSSTATLFHIMDIIECNSIEKSFKVYLVDCIYGTHIDKQKSQFICGSELTEFGKDYFSFKFGNNLVVVGNNKIYVCKN